MFSIRLDQPTQDALGILAKRSSLDTSAFVRKIINNYLAKNRTKVAKELIFNEVQKHDLNQFVTIPFVQASDPEAAYRRLSGKTKNATTPAKPFALFERDRPTGERLVKAYFSAMRRKFGSKGNLPALGVYETVKKNGIDATFLHYHCLLAIPEPEEGRFAEATSDFWTSVGNRHFGAPITCQVERANSKDAVAQYALKNVNDDYPLDSIIMVGFDPPTPSAGYPLTAQNDVNRI
ncbi:hypothetical protein [Mesorhizobium sp. M7A.F.Ca.MR.148.00.0.0]|uniref:hypothetical protein n=1 Tax=Mesorhizobium sp. M7A.F.Ca.MR.148.00.0.0 TaxID=2496775 RepID=UPI000FCAF2D3|nr:hypothetical protein [Mesorhizobium sp. M7A.F.Ca.MR.148.00.0.0]RUV33154.1 hypothetical protein EOB49_31905 [Mesorhizobium sp. M7A.F.Ca.MR.148.00.0.0]